ncbi:uncharacterized protein BDR25DRAFT_11861 [Lindgomyces ingoldianus]|uniref:Uncharacterized protein n=1 Tax=Lindgomyces ingoldianus TaxID=673940 RepID=A0ACB6R0Y7_9PLEO|nr:uncharacterized protein BDR25DRAFT_11861 [Lindgomyces ingoldianus]KAF2472846.1 hypothetical protein BDR25DRAFT_11861 [Lindgomyces ingoldianus]
MDATSALKIVFKVRRWLSKSRPSRPDANSPNLTQPTDTFPFLRLPSEIRNMIYRELLLCTYPLIMFFRSAFWFENSTRAYPAILQSNRQIHDEAAAVLYGENTWFSVAPLLVFPSWGDAARGRRGTYDLPASTSEMYISRIRRFVLFPDGPPNWMRDGVVARGDVRTMLRRMGFDHENLTHFVVGCLTPKMCDEVASANEDWLEEVDDEDMKRRYAWYKYGDPKPSHWLVLKE